MACEGRNSRGKTEYRSGRGVREWGRIVEGGKVRGNAGGGRVGGGGKLGGSGGGMCRKEVGKVGGFHLSVGGGGGGG